MNVRIEDSWNRALTAEWDKPYFVTLTNFVKEQYSDRTKMIFPPASKIFAAFDNCPFDKVKVVILGQDPYHGPGQANGLSFSVGAGVQFPPSLVNIFKEVQSDFNLAEPIVNGDLSRWARQGVLMLNSTLTVEAHRPTSHQGQGWEQFTDEVIKQLNDKREHIVFILWGSYAIKKGAIIDRNKHCVITSVHPSPLSAYRGFFGSRPFSKANAYLVSTNQTPIDWR
jgi:uracil-DNA glycosylase